MKKKYRIIPEYIFMYGPKMAELTKGGLVLYDEMVHDLHCSEHFACDKNESVG